MPNIPWEAWLIIGAIVAATLLAVLHALASAVRLETHVHETRIKAASLQRRYAEQLAELEAQKSLDREIEVVGQGSRRAA